MSANTNTRVTGSYPPVLPEGAASVLPPPQARCERVKVAAPRLHCRCETCREARRTK